MDTSTSDAELLARIRRDDPAAFEALVDRYGDRIYRFALRMAGNVADAQDVLQETLLKAFRSLATLEHPEALRSWLYRVAANELLMMRRKGKFEPERELSLSDLGPRQGDGPAAQIPDPAALPDEMAARAELSERVQQAIGDLPEQYRIVVVMRDIEQFSTQEVAATLGLELSAVKMRLSRGRLRVRQRLEELLREKAPEGRRA